MANWFVALRVPAADWLARVVSDAPADLRLFHAEDLHMTVAFLGHVDEAAARGAWARRSVHQRFEVTLGTLAALGPRRRPSAISALLSRGAERAAAIIGLERDGMLAAAGRPPERRAPLAHVTVARPARKASAAARTRALSWASAKPAIDATLTIDSLALYTWSDDRVARLFRVVEVAALT